MARKRTARNTLEDRINALEYRGEDDEVWYVFSNTCNLCYAMYGLGMTTEAEMLCRFAEDMAAATVHEDWPIRRITWGSY